MNDRSAFGFQQGSSTSVMGSGVELLITTKMYAGPPAHSVEGRLCVSAL
jgi:hypothetical protein